jgi:hypothetical protein
MSEELNETVESRELGCFKSVASVSIPVSGTRME